MNKILEDILKSNPLSEEEINKMPNGRFYLLIQKLDEIEKSLLSTKKVLSFDEACRYTGFTSSYMYKLTANGSIPFSKPMGKVLFFDRQKLDEWLLTTNE